MDGLSSGELIPPLGRKMIHKGPEHGAHNSMLCVEVAIPCGAHFADRDPTHRLVTNEPRQAQKIPKSKAPTTWRRDTDRLWVFHPHSFDEGC